MFSNSTLNTIIQPLRLIDAEENMEKLDKDSDSKGFKSWNQLLTMVVCQLDSHDSLRSLIESYNAHSEQHYHLKSASVPRSTLSYANANRDVSEFSEVLRDLIKYASNLPRKNRAEMREIINLIDSSPIPLNPKLFGDLAVSNGRIKGMKFHLEYDATDCIPKDFAFTSANVNDVEYVKNMSINVGETYVFDKGYYSFDFWTKLHEKKCRFVTRIKSNTGYEVLETRSIPRDCGNVLTDQVVKLTGQRAKKSLVFNLRLIKIKRENGKEITIISNDTLSSARKIAELYKTRWDIELFFKWIKQSLKIKKFIGRNENAIKIQIVTALIAYLLVYILNYYESANKPLLQTFREVKTFLYQRFRMDNLLDKRRNKHKNQLEFKWLAA